MSPYLSLIDFSIMPLFFRAEGQSNCEYSLENILLTIDCPMGQEAVHLKRDPFELQLLPLKIFQCLDHKG